MTSGGAQPGGGGAWCDAGHGRNPTAPSGWSTVSQSECPKIGWCWAGNRHTRLGFASAGSRDSTSD
ncbi:DUF5701 family protein [Mycobacterium sp. ITM-2016-00318]|uniref:DUF5701 family protein n=1 Tax=Mycobacterium sp. ITM-2016-00318 TaxID=2099693 RepID=UPI001E2EB6B6|nr:DUF5701 family protein [Mycobacterium sp. ITM-2016-00318]WNG95489.1 DUF5701 family protein [Mycobacterium sp. ITM-2016-00318]